MHIYILDDVVTRISLKTNPLESYESLEFTDSDQIFAMIGYLQIESKKYAICVIPGAKNTTSAKLFRYSTKINPNFYKNLNKKKTGILK
jgi:hypothetical protein